MDAIAISKRSLVSEWFYFVRDCKDIVWSPVVKRMPTWIVPDYITLSRIPLTIPTILFLFYYPCRAIAFLFYFLAILTDDLDGALARHRRCFSAYGFIIDPLADKILNDLLYLGFICYPYNLEIASMKIAFWAVVVPDLIIFVLGGLFYIITRRRIESNPAGKVKFIMQCIGSMMIILGIGRFVEFVVWVAAVLGTISLFWHLFDAFKKF